MKIIISRKGFDSANGGIVSPIFEDGSMISFPIPSDDKDYYTELYFGNTSYAKILSDLKYKGIETCHVDPDLSIDRRKSKIKDWKPIFGQINSSANYLINNVKVEVGDIFLFFGNFHKVKNESGKYNYVRRTGDFYQDMDLQVIWGYLQIGEIIFDSKEQEKYNWHPHSIKTRTSNSSNVMFKASDRLSFNHEMNGAGLLPFNIKRVLTAKGCNKATWKYNKVYDLDAIIGNRKNSSKIPGTIYYAGIWQELGLAESKESEEWAKGIIIDK